MSLFDKTFELSLARSYVSHWGLAEAVRELIQNAIDSASPFVYEFRNDSDDGTASLRLFSEFSHLTPQSLLLGTTSKASDPDAIGSFGEGYKIALLVLTRLGYPVEIQNGDVLWRPAFRHNRRFGEEVLVIEETTRPDKGTGLAFVIHGLAQDDVAAIVDSCLLMQSHIGAIKITTRGDILLERPGRLYVGGLFICPTDLKFGYNIKPQHVKLERDRQTVSSYDLHETTLAMWYETKEFDRIAEMIDEGVPDLQYARYDAPDMVKQACYELFRKNNPGAIVAESQQELKQLVAQGMERVVVVNSGMYHSVRSSPGYRSEPRARVVSPSERIDAFYATHKYNMHVKVRNAFAALIAEARDWKLK